MTAELNHSFFLEDISSLIPVRFILIGSGKPIFSKHGSAINAVEIFVGRIYLSEIKVYLGHCGILPAGILVGRVFFLGIFR